MQKTTEYTENSAHKDVDGKVVMDRCARHTEKTHPTPSHPMTPLPSRGNSCELLSPALSRRDLACGCQSFTRCQGRNRLILATKISTCEFDKCKGGETSCGWSGWWVEKRESPPPHPHPPPPQTWPTAAGGDFHGGRLWTNVEQTLTVGRSSGCQATQLDERQWHCVYRCTHRHKALDLQWRVAEPAHRGCPTQNLPEYSTSGC